MTTSRGSRFASPNEEAQYWDTHDFSEVWHTAQPTIIHREKVLTRSITIRFDESTLTYLRQKAQTMGIGPTTLVRMWIKDRMESDDTARRE